MKIKKSLLTILCLLLSLSLLVGCEIGTYNPPNVEKPNDGNQSDGTPDGSTPPSDQGTPFTARLTYMGFPLVAAEGIKVQWNDGYSYHIGTVDQNAVAKVYGLDGDYRVTLLSVPDGYAYNPNVYLATSNSPDIEIKLYRLEETVGDGSDLYDSIIKMNGTGVYSATLESEDDVIFFEFKPSRNGNYSIESWMDVTAENVNPKVDIYNGTFAAKFFYMTKDDGGAASGFTKNFKYEVEVADEGLGNVFSFGVKALTKDETFPVTVNFAITLNGDFYVDRTDKIMVIPSQLPTVLKDGRDLTDFASKEAFIAAFIAEHEYDSDYIIIGPEIKSGSKNIFDGTLYALNPETGFYHRYDKETDTYGEILYAYISGTCRFYDQPLTTIEYAGNKNLTLSDGNYKYFIEGTGAFTTGYFCVRDSFGNVYCPCIPTTGGVCLEGCTSCHPQCNNASAELLNSMGGYADFCNSDGLCPVTEELKEFLQKFSATQQLFSDGNGWVESNPSVSVDAMEDDQWLFACAMYVKK